MNLDLPLHRMSLTELKETRKQLRAEKRPRAKLKHHMLLLACNAWIRKREKER